MSVLVGAAVACAGAALLTLIARRERRRTHAARSGILDRCRLLFEEAEMERGADGFPRLTGCMGGMKVRLDLIPDTMTIRRLPQLWLSVTLLERIAVPGGLAALVRPSGAEFYSLTQRFDVTLPAPPGFPEETLLRGQNRAAGRLVERAAPTMAALLADPKVKEVAVTAMGARVIRQAAEGRRGDYLLLRQCAFDGAQIEPGMVLSMVDGLEALRVSLGSRDGGPARRQGVVGPDGDLA